MGHTRTHGVIRMARGLGVLAGGLVLLLVEPLALPMPVWRTGERLAPPPSASARPAARAHLATRASNGSAGGRSGHRRSRSEVHHSADPS
jgi:hypothetical protein